MNYKVSLKVASVCLINTCLTAKNFNLVSDLKESFKGKNMYMAKYKFQKVTTISKLL